MIKTLRLAAILLIGGVLTGAGAKTPPDKEAAALAVAEAWLALVDAGDYAQSWDEAAVLFRDSISPEQWQEVLDAVRRPLGETRSRELLSTSYWTELPGAPDGHYVLIQFDTSFENKRNSVETITPMLDQDGKWRVSGYYIK
ncbi:MAG: DUF4019 domain-containing protein [Pseudomonadota bacterium]